MIVRGHDQPAVLSYNGYPDRIFRTGIEKIAVKLVPNLSGIKAIQERPIPAVIFVYEKSKRKIKRQRVGCFPNEWLLRFGLPVGHIPKQERSRTHGPH